MTKEPVVNMVGNKFGRLTVVKISNKQIKGHKTYIDCLCECGVLKTVSSGHVRSGLTQSCGCWQKEVMMSINMTHGFRTTNTEGEVIKDYRYSTYRGMIKRCYDKKCKGYSDYGGRGIKVCARWRKSFLNFIKDIGERPSIKYTIDRVDNDGNYCVSNFRWATRSTQNKNRRKFKKHAKIVCAKR